MTISKAKSAPHSTKDDTTAAVDEFMLSLQSPKHELVQALREVILKVDNTVAEGIKWNAPSFRTSEYFATTNLRVKQGIGVILHLGAKVRELPEGEIAIKDPLGMLKWLAKDRAAIEFTDLASFRSAKSAFQAILKQWLLHV